MTTLSDHRPGSVERPLPPAPVLPESYVPAAVPPPAPERVEHHHGELVEELVEELHASADDVSLPVVLAWFAMVVLFAVAAPIAGHVRTGGGPDTLFFMLWSVGVVVAVVGGIPFFRAHRGALATAGIAIAVLLPLTIAPMLA